MKDKYILIIIIAVFASLTIATSFNYTYDTDTPVGTDAPSVLDNRIREVKDAVQERLNVDHYFELTGSQVSDANTGEHRQITFHSPISDTPTVDSSKGKLRIKDVDGVAELFWTDENESDLQLTSGGTLNISSSDLIGTLENNVYFTSLNAAGDGTVSLIGSDTSDNPVIPDGAKLATSAAPEDDEDIANKKYVDDQVAGPASWDPETYAGQESVTFPNGFIMKMGVKGGVTAGGTSTITFSEAFPSNIVSYNAVTVTAGAITSTATVESALKNTMNLRNNDGTTRSIAWQAWGY